MDGTTNHRTKKGSGHTSVHKINKPGSKLEKRSNQGTLTLRDSNIMTRALMSIFYKKRFESGKYSIKVM